MTFFSVFIASAIANFFAVLILIVYYAFETNEVIKGDKGSSKGIFTIEHHTPAVTHTVFYLLVIINICVFTKLTLKETWEIPLGQFAGAFMWLALGASLIFYLKLEF